MAGYETGAAEGKAGALGRSRARLMAGLSFVKLLALLGIWGAAAATSACSQGTPASPLAPPRASPAAPTPAPGSAQVQVPPLPSQEILPTALATPEPTPQPAELPQPSPVPSPAGVPLPAPATTGPPAPAAAVFIPEPPERDLFELAQRLRPASSTPASRVVNPDPVSYPVGHQESFTIFRLSDATTYTVKATLNLVSEHAYWYVDDTLSIPLSELQEAAEAFEGHIRPLVTKAFGDIWDPGVDNDPHLTVLHTPLGAAGGYFGSQDEYSRQVHPSSNEREMIYMDGRTLRPGSADYLGVLAHEFQHAVHWNLDAGEEAWIDEGMSEVAKTLAGYPGSFIGNFLQNPGTPLDYWPDEIESSAPYYGAAALFLSYLTLHYGSFETVFGSLKRLVQEQADGINGVEKYLQSYGRTFLQVYKDWVVANYLDASGGPWSYPGRQVRVLNVDSLPSYGEIQGSLRQFASRYIDVRLEEGDALVTFQGNPEISQHGASCFGGQYCWWSNQGDSIDSTLTREFDLSGLTAATLQFWTWFNIEEDWDYGYVEASNDGGLSWTILAGQHTTADNPSGNSYGHGWTGKSEGWVQESLDLTPYTGGKVLVRFEYITDDAAYLDGLVIDDVAIPALGFFDDAEHDAGWEAKGFVRSNNKLPQEYAVQLIEEEVGGRVLVREMTLEKTGLGQMVVEGFGSRLEHVVIIISPVSRGTHQPAQFTLTVSLATE